MSATLPVPFRSSRRTSLRGSGRRCTSTTTARSEEVVCGPGSFVFIPRGSPHTFQDVPGRKPEAELLLPRCDGRVLRPLATALEGGLVDEAELGRIAREHAMEIVGPPPERYV